MKEVEISAKTVEEAIQQALEELCASRDEVEVDVLSEGRHGVLGVWAEEAKEEDPQICLSRELLLSFTNVGKDTVNEVEKFVVLEKEIEKDLHQLIDQVEGIRFSDFKQLSNKAEASLGYWNKNIKKTIGSAGSDYKTYEKDRDTKIETKIYLFPMIQMFCETKKGSKYEIYSLGSANKFMIYSNF